MLQKLYEETEGSRRLAGQRSALYALSPPPIAYLSNVLNISRVQRHNRSNCCSSGAHANLPRLPSSPVLR